ncbi:MAG: hypothetical protein H6502_04200 [Candidatus Woesearchaeota archaeon]|nr:MAG: hypothetical protein H6502_04200 [Candidatus Woesearchaeota archaeon]
MAQLDIQPTGELFQYILADSRVAAHLAAMRQLDVNLREHALRTGWIAIEVATHLRLPQQHVLNTGYAAILHDDGKRKMEDAATILHSASPLTRDQQAQIYEHPRLTYLITAGFPEEIRRAAAGSHDWQEHTYRRQHAERRRLVRGPDRRADEHEIALLAQIVGVADQSDALTDPSRRYRRPVPLNKLEAELNKQYTGSPHIRNAALEVMHRRQRIEDHSSQYR